MSSKWQARILRCLIRGIKERLENKNEGAGASVWNKQPKLLNLLVDNKPAYPDGIPKSEGQKNGSSKY